MKNVNGGVLLYCFGEICKWRYTLTWVWIQYGKIIFGIQFVPHASRRV